MCALAQPLRKPAEAGNGVLSMLSLNDSIITGLLLPKYDLFHMANSLL